MAVTVRDVPEALGHPWPSPADVFARLAGSWRIIRRVTPGGTLRGSCQFARGRDGALLAREGGDLVLDDGTRLTSRRSLLYRAEPEGFSVWFPEETLRLFHVLRLHPTPDGLAGAARHLCGQDRYDSVYTFAPDGTFRVRHEAAGPWKAYVSLTHFTRLTGEQPPFFANFNLDVFQV